MNIHQLPRKINRIVVPPIKCQGIKTQLVRSILCSLTWNGQGRWIEPFVGSGVVVFNVQPQRALLNDINPYIIRLYRAIWDGSITPAMVREHFTTEGARLLTQGESYYYLVRERFNRNGDPLDFLFLNRSCFNGLIRFNRRGEFNVPFCRKPDRFRPAYITKIVNQVVRIQKIMQGKDWEFRVGDWRECLMCLDKDDFVYFDPPYIGRHTDYYQQWSDNDAVELAMMARNLPCGFALSMWKENKYRTNSHIEQHWNGQVERTFTHFYHVGSVETFRNSIQEVLLIKPGYESLFPQQVEPAKPAQLVMNLET
ncbi:MAG TPA: Dam family site-specific DNA-(adenine-N6)-methyltransferase [Chthonomonas sp.]|uniref:DNA adenine methylase n=1 Tax=Chthonomonas sp. TaxID=2282153 RepID=UPI002B4AE833|nr:Dam family site-specific DNA-(adenine-N6)-methyltransferase [Chthonomonas sp.]HLI49647.1 Dam family site-specific DNA-(adenine-N6)-methyltransferase [Chthonomonas sp.]